MIVNNDGFLRNTQAHSACRHLTPPGKSVPFDGEFRRPRPDGKLPSKCSHRGRVTNLLRTLGYSHHSSIERFAKNGNFSTYYSSHS